MNHFTIESGRVVVTDPCYDLPSTGALELDVSPGEWCVAVEEVLTDGWRVASVRAWLSGAGAVFAGLHAGYIGVDSGQAGIFDLQHYQKDSCWAGFDYKKSWENPLSPLVGEREGFEERDRFYNVCCDNTLDGRSGLLKHGVVSRTGYGDGQYQVFVGTDQRGKVISIRIVFIGDEDE